MDTYKIDPHAHGWFQVTVTAPNGKSWVRHPFASEWAAQKWADKRQQNQGKTAPPTGQVVDAVEARLRTIFGRTLGPNLDGSI